MRSLMKPLVVATALSLAILMGSVWSPRQASAFEFKWIDANGDCIYWCDIDLYHCPCLCLATREDPWRCLELR